MLERHSVVYSQEDRKAVGGKGPGSSASHPEEWLLAPCLHIDVCHGGLNGVLCRVKGCTSGRRRSGGALSKWSLRRSWDRCPFNSCAQPACGCAPCLRAWCPGLRSASRNARGSMPASRGGRTGSCMQVCMPPVPLEGSLFAQGTAASGRSRLLQQAPPASA